MLLFMARVLLQGVAFFCIMKKYFRANLQNAPGRRYRENGLTKAADKVPDSFCASYAHKERNEEHVRKSLYKYELCRTGEKGGAVLEREPHL